MKNIEDIIQFFDQGGDWSNGFIPRNIGRILKEKKLVNQPASLKQENWNTGEGCDFTYFKKFTISTKDGDIIFLCQNNMLFEGEGKDRIRHF